MRWTAGNLEHEDDLYCTGVHVNKGRRLFFFFFYSPLNREETLCIEFLGFFFCSFILSLKLKERRLFGSIWLYIHRFSFLNSG